MYQHEWMLCHIPLCAGDGYQRRRRGNISININMYRGIKISYHITYIECGHQHTTATLDMQLDRKYRPILYLELFRFNIQLFEITCKSHTRLGCNRTVKVDGKWVWGIGGLFWSERWWLWNFFWFVIIVHPVECVCGTWTQNRSASGFEKTRAR